MAITIDYLTYEILIPKADTTFVKFEVLTGLEVRQLNLDAFRLALGDIQDNASDVWALTAFEHTAPVDIGGTLLARVVSIINGYIVTFENGNYAVEFAGGNTNLASVVTVNNVSIRPNNSAGQTFSKQAEDTAFGDNRVWINTIEGLPGTIYPLGTTGNPVSNLADAQAIIATRSLPKRLHLTGTIVTTGLDSIANYDIVGASARLSFLNITTGTNTTNLVIATISMTGDLNGNITASNATSFDNIMDFDGRMILCGIAGVIDLGFAGEVHELIDCFSEEAGVLKPVISCDNLANSYVQFRRYSGGLKITNFSDAGGNMSLDFNQGSLELDASCTGGTIVVRGDATILDNSGPNCTVVDNTTIYYIEESIAWARKSSDNAVQANLKL